MAEAKPPETCENLGEIRMGIDHLDRQIIDILKQRMGYVEAAANFKPDEQSIPAPERVTAMLADRRTWAEETGLSPDFIQPLFSTIIQWFIEQQIRHWRAQRGLD